MYQESGQVSPSTVSFSTDWWRSRERRPAGGREWARPPPPAGADGRESGSRWRRPEHPGSADRHGDEPAQPRPRSDGSPAADGVDEPSDLKCPLSRERIRSATAAAAWSARPSGCGFFARRFASPVEVQVRSEHCDRPDVAASHRNGLYRTVSFKPPKRGSGQGAQRSSSVVDAISSRTAATARS